MTVRLHVWRVRRRAVPLAFWGMAADRRRLRRQAGFVKLLGTGRGSDFGAGKADLTRWAAIIVGDAMVAPPMRGATASCVITLEPVASRGTWAGQEPFEPAAPPSGTGMIAVLTRARLKTRKAPAFWKAIDPVSRALPGAEGMICAFGVGEAPVGFQGTVSLWRSAADVIRFAYRQPEHAAVVDRTAREGWYAEELFARFRVLDVAGDREVIGWRDSP
ncbi:monooxygenase [Dactylosporangium sp. NPDC005555]|uniref:monooxygenase n=1 Tax=Dactylosporangium sp. NPDC005555 TaxID=3154889 RepID=UPI0033B528D8